MKPDGTYTVDEILQICNDQLQSWERDKICVELLKNCSDNNLSEFFSRYTPEYISLITGYYVSDEEPAKEKEIEDFMLHEIINGLIDKLHYITLKPEHRDLLLKAIEDNKNGEL